MSYYEDLIFKVDNLIKEEKYKKAESLINQELALPYVPKDIENKLFERLSSLPKEDINTSLKDDEIVDYLEGNEICQLRAVDELNKRNLRDYIDICNKYLCSNGYINAKALLVDSLIRQDIGDDIKMTNEGIEYSFIPKYIVPPEDSFGYRKAIDILNDKFMKEPSKLELSKQLVYKECLLALPINYEEEDGELLADKVFGYIDEAFK